MRKRKESGESSSPGSFSQQQLRRHAAELFHYEFSLLWPLINNISLVLFFFFFFKRNMLVLSCCIFQSSMTMVSGLDCYLAECACVCAGVCV